MTPKHLSILRILALNMMSGCIDLVYAVEGAYFVPAIYNLGLPPIYGAMLLCLSPIMGIIFQSYLGSASDQCQCWWGRRRPFIIALAIGCVIGLILFPFTEDLANLIDKPKSRDVFLIVVITISTFLVDFNIGSLQVPVRAYLLDVIPHSQSKVGNIIYTICASSGAAIGFGIGAVKWSSIFLSSNNFSFQVKFVCIATLLIAILCANVTLCSVKEQNPKLFGDYESTDLELDIFGINKLHSKGIQTDSYLPYAKQNIMEWRSMDEIVIKLGNDSFVKYKSKTCQCTCFANFINSLRGNYSFVKSMSLSMVILFIAFFLILVAAFTQLFFFTSYVAEVIYDGDVNAPENSTAYQDYTDGVTFGSLALGISAVVALVFSLLLGPIIKLVGMRFVFVASYVLLMLQSGIQIVVHNRIVAIVLAPAIYITVITILSIPFIFVSMYDSKGLLLRKRKSADENLIGRACGIMIIALLGGQVFALVVNGPLIEVYGSTVVVMISTCAASFVGAVVACFVTVPMESKKKVELQKYVQKAEASTQTELE